MIALLLVTAMWGAVLTGEVLTGKLTGKLTEAADKIGSTAAKRRAEIKPGPQSGRVGHAEFSKLSERWRERKADGTRGKSGGTGRGEMDPGWLGAPPWGGACGSDLLGMGAFSVALDIEVNKPDCVLAQSCPVPWPL